MLGFWDLLYSKKLSAMHGEEGRPVSTDDASYWDLSTTRDGFLYGTMIAFQAGALGVEDPEMADFYHRLMFAFAIAHTFSGPT